MALLLVHLHGKRTDSLSNQMRQTKSLSPQYAVRWWDERGLEPPDIDPVEFMKKKLKWRYAKGIRLCGKQGLPRRQREGASKGPEGGLHRRGPRRQSCFLHHRRIVA